MKKSQYIKQRRMCQRNLKRATCKNLIYHAVICLFIIIIALFGAVGKCMENSEDIVESQYETTRPQFAPADSVPTIQAPTITQENEDKAKTAISMCPKFTYSKDWDYEDSYLLAKIAMAEAEGCNIRTKTLVIMTILNRVWSDEFPDTIEEVIFQENQFSPINNGRWDRVEPNNDCWEAVQIVMEAAYDYSEGALYFESCANKDNWHSRNLEFLYESDGLRFYK
jgi:spore germination cell wall hydrolase CwlJ-like protein